MSAAEGGGLGAEDLTWQVEYACLNARPSPVQALLQGWLLRVAGGPLRGLNSVTPLRSASYDPSAIIDACVSAYAARGQQTMFRVPSIAPGLDEVLGGYGYVAQAESLTLLAGLNAIPQGSGWSVELASQASADWLAVRGEVNGAAPPADRVFDAMISAIALPTAFATLRVEGKAASIAYGVLDGRLLVIESVATALEARGRGLARRTVAALMDWGRTRGAQAACLQVLGDNSPALSVYRALGFDRELYRYHYRRAAIE